MRHDHKSSIYANEHELEEGLPAKAAKRRESEGLIDFFVGACLSGDLCVFWYADRLTSRLLRLVN